MEQKFVEALLLLNEVTQKLKAISAELDGVNTAICDLAMTTLPTPQTISPEDYE
jgi:hypothetical protein